MNSGMLWTTFLEMSHIRISQPRRQLDWTARRRVVIGGCSALRCWAFSPAHRRCRRAHHECSLTIAGEAGTKEGSGKKTAPLKPRPRHLVSWFLTVVTLQAAVGVVATFALAAIQAYEIRLFAIKE
jgi:hypothetical protein